MYRFRVVRNKVLRCFRLSRSPKTPKPQAPVKQQPLCVRIYHGWFYSKRKLLDSAWLAKVARVFCSASYIGIVAQSAVLAGLEKSVLWLFTLNLAFVFVFAAASLFSEWLPKREVRPKVSDVHHIRELEAKLRNLFDELEQHSTSLECITMLGEAFMKQAFEAACKAVCAERDIWVSFMREDDDQTLRVSIIYPQEGRYHSKTEIPLQVNADGYKLPPDGLGVAGYAYGLCTSVYVPNVALRIAYVVDASISGKVEYNWLGRVWKPSDAQRYRSVISVPVYVSQESERRPLGILNFESASRDAFGSADFHVACLTAGLLSLGLQATMKLT